MSDLIQKAIDEAIGNGVFTAAAADGVAAMRKELADTKECLARADEMVRKLREASTNDREEIVRLRLKGDQQTGTITALKETIADREGDHIKACVANARAEAYRESLQTVFKPATVRRALHGGEYVHQNQDGSGTASRHPDIIADEEEV